MLATELLAEGKAYNIAHRGYTVAAPENTMKAFQDAITLGADGIELDVRTCKSGEVVVFHDAKLERMTNGVGLVKNKSLDELRELRIVAAGKETAQAIPTLDDVLELTRGHLFVNIEIKANGLTVRHNIEEKVLDICRRFGLEHKVVISSFNPLSVRKVRKFDRQAVNGFIIDSKVAAANGELFITKLSGGRGIHIEGALLTPELGVKVREKGYYLMAWTINEPAEMQRCLDLNLNGIITDRPDLLKKLTQGGLDA